MSDLQTSIIIPVFNQAALTEQCLNAILEEQSAEIIVVDDGSTDATQKVLACYRRRIRVKRHDTNVGFAQSCNDGASVASGNYLVFLNNDTIPQPGWLDTLVEHARRHADVGVVGAKLLYPDDTVQHAGVVICQDLYPRHLYTGFPSAHPAVNKARPFQVVTGACMLVPRSTFAALSGFDPAFRNGFEDVDFCLRAGEAGLQVHYCPESVLYHFESSSPGRFRHEPENVALYRQRWMSRVRPDDFNYYAEDGLFRLNYEGHLPFHLQVSPLLGMLDLESRQSETEKLLAERARQVQDLTREVTRLRRHLQTDQPGSSALQYDALRKRIQQAVAQVVPLGGTVLVVSKGDGALLRLGNRVGWHFPQSPSGGYAGHHPADSAAAIAQVEFLRSKGAEYLVLPSTAYWWLEHYSEFGEYLTLRCRRIPVASDVCQIFALNSPLESAARSAAASVSGCRICPIEA